MEFGILKMAVINMILSRCPEPTEIGEFTIEVIKQKLREETLNYPNMLLQNLASYLWTDCNWKSVLKEKGMNWKTDFQKIIPPFYADIKNWVLGGISWENLLNNIENSKQVQRYLMRE